MNHDGAADLVTANGGSSTVAVLLSDLATLSTPPTSPVTHLELAPARPNPSRSGFTLDLALPEAAFVQLDVFDVHGRRIDTIESAELPAGRTSRTWDGRGADGTPASPGLYFMQLRSRGVTLARKVMLTR
jgi:hypothetical protein